MKKNQLLTIIYIYSWIGIISILIYLQLLLGATTSLNVNRYWAHNIIICFLINTLIFNLSKKRSTLIILSLIFFLWSVISHFVLQLHGSALCFSLFKNFKTATTVIDNYNLTVDSRVFIIAFLFIATVAVIFLFPKHNIDEYHSEKLGIVWKVSFMAFCTFYAFFSYSIANNNMSWAPFFIIDQRGYCSYLITDSIYCFNHFSKPEGYDIKEIPTDINGWDDNLSNTNPDILVILNESFCDISLFSDVKTDVDPLSDLYSIDNLTYGYCIVPSAGGGTNNAEYELLTSNSLALLSVGAPFNYINFEKHNKSIVTYLENNNYSTYAFHCFSKENYNRKIAYTSMGFDNIFLGPDKFDYYSKNGNRHWLDQDNYNDMIRVYNEYPDSPKFMYILTYQNHGGYEQNPSELDTVHSEGTYDVANDIIDEYESSLELSTQAFKELTDYYASVDRPVIICMVGDHAFSYAPSLCKPYDSKEEKEIRVRTVPYLLWSNYQIDRKTFTQYTTLTDIMPSVVYSAGLELDDYYKQILNLHELMPGRSTYGMYFDNNGALQSIADTSPVADAWKKYLFAEYQRLTG